MQTRTRVVVSSALTLVVSLALVACSRRSHRPQPAATPPPVEEESKLASAKSSASEDMPAPEPKGRDNQALAAAFSAFNDKPLRPPAPKNAETRATLEVKYHDSTPAEMQAALDSLLEVLDAQVHQRTEDKMPTSRSQLAALSDEVGWLSERCGR